ncbi:hypothetical protein DDZ14_05800 [Maritimibacter sp. 55A14]|uniref:tetratricopeptide repeat protein n=1 Tax=Maritimibacter sp. 55A14 TaxID=2174844 RepID=UPI000D60CEB2|nr:tetratricopeptide repeat protein [Maritimibacter sp. 55A14]PWE33298.1 hypothetical protein DDZ14_05800 [Maritimibacter sp. 55A14]
MRTLLALLMLGAPALGDTCPPLPDRAGERAQLLAEAHEAPDARAGRIAMNALWEFWATAPDDRAQDLLDRGMERRASYDFEAAHDAFDALVNYCPHYAEGYNQRGFVHFLRGQYGYALEDLNRALARDPQHVAAMAGKAVTLMNLGRIKAGQAVLREALTLNPWLPERGMLLAEPGEEL